MAAYDVSNDFSITFIHGDKTPGALARALMFINADLIDFICMPAYSARKAVVSSGLN